jgi:hypothetical protein
MSEKDIHPHKSKTNEVPLMQTDTQTQKDLDVRNKDLYMQLREKRRQAQQANIKNARIKLICDWYEYRGDTVEYTANRVPNGVRDILKPFWIYKITD